MLFGRSTAQSSVESAPRLVTPPHPRRGEFCGLPALRRDLLIGRRVHSADLVVRSGDSHVLIVRRRCRGPHSRQQWRIGSARTVTWYFFLLFLTGRQCHGPWASSTVTTHNRRRTELFLGGLLASWTAKWKGKTVVFAHVKAHSSITVNEWVDVEAKATLGAAISIYLRSRVAPACLGGYRHTAKDDDSLYTAASIRVWVRTWACAAIQEAVIEWLRGSSAGTHAA